MQRLGVAGAVTETNTEQGHINFDLADQYGLSWMHWGYKKFSNWTWDDVGLFDRTCTSSNPYDCAVTSIVKNYARTYPRAVAGETIHFNYNDTTGDAMLKFTPNFDCELPTEIFLSETWVYKYGFEVKIQGDLASLTTWTSPKRDIIHITVDKEALKLEASDKTVEIYISHRKDN